MPPIEEIEPPQTTDIYEGERPASGGVVPSAGFPNPPMVFGGVGGFPGSMGPANNFRYQMQMGEDIVFVDPVNQRIYPSPASSSPIACGWERLSLEEYRTETSDHARNESERNRLRNEVSDMQDLMSARSCPTNVRLTPEQARSREVVFSSRGEVCLGQITRLTRTQNRMKEIRQEVAAHYRPVPGDEGFQALFANADEDQQNVIYGNLQSEINDYSNYETLIDFQRWAREEMERYNCQSVSPDEMAEARRRTLEIDRCDNYSMRFQQAQRQLDNLSYESITETTAMLERDITDCVAGAASGEFRNQAGSVSTRTSSTGRLPTVEQLQAR